MPTKTMRGLRNRLKVIHQLKNGDRKTSPLLLATLQANTTVTLCDSTAAFPLTVRYFLAKMGNGKRDITVVFTQDEAREMFETSRKL